MKEILNTNELTREVLAFFPEIDANSYDSEEIYCNPLESKHGKHNNWANASSGFLPKNTTEKIKESDTIAQGIAQVCKVGMNEFVKYSGKVPTNGHIVGLIEKVIIRFGIGAKAERMIENKLENQMNVQKNPSKPNDENNGVDIRTDNMLIQSKFGADFKYSWDSPKVQEKGKESVLLWVKPNGKVLKYTENGKTERDKYKVFLK